MGKTGDKKCAGMCGAGHSSSHGGRGGGGDEGMMNIHPGKRYCACGGNLPMCLSGHDLIASSVGRPSFPLPLTWNSVSYTLRRSRIYRSRYHI